MSEFSRKVDVDKIQADHRIEANAEECAAVAKRLELLGLEGFSADFVLTPKQDGHLIQVTGTVQARVTQACVVTLDPVVAEVTAEVEAEFTDGPIPTLDNDFDLELDGPDAPEPIEGGKVDLGELAVQNLALALDPYPRKPGAEFPGYVSEG